jgi:4-hydroxy-tetrahydrodipicolinate synthase
MIDWSGVFHVMATPFTDGGELDAGGLPRLVEAALATGISGVTILGIAGEAHRLTDEERRRVVEGVVKEVRGRVPVVVGVSASGTHLATAFSRMAQEHGTDGLMVAPPTGLKNLDAVEQYYRTVAAAASVPLVLQDEPVTTQVTMPAAFMARLCEEIPGIEAIKIEEAPTLPKITRLRELLGKRVVGPVRERVAVDQEQHGAVALADAALARAQLGLTFRGLDRNQPCDHTTLLAPLELGRYCAAKRRAGRVRVARDPR